MKELLGKTIEQVMDVLHQKYAKPDYTVGSIIEVGPTGQRKLVYVTGTWPEWYVIDMIFIEGTLERIIKFKVEEYAG